MGWVLHNHFKYWGMHNHFPLGANASLLVQKAGKTASGLHQQQQVDYSIPRWEISEVEMILWEAVN